MWVRQGERVATPVGNRVEVGELGGGGKGEGKGGWLVVRVVARRGDGNGVCSFARYDEY